MFWKWKIFDFSYKVEISWDIENVLERDLEVIFELLYGGLESIVIFLL